MTSNCTLPRRLMAMLYDGLLLLALQFLGTLPFIAIRGGEPVDPGELTYQLMLLGIAWLFFCGFWTFAGRTLGMQSWGLRVETASGDRPNLARSTLRFVLAVVSWLPFGLGFFWQLWDANGLTIHDRWSGTCLKFTPRS
jgi:uncharacterized RDD family membrane protein YckC